MTAEVVVALTVVVVVSSVSPICRRAAARNTHANGDSDTPPDTAPRKDDTRLRTTAATGDATVFCTDSWSVVVVAGDVVAAAVVATATESCWTAAEVAVDAGALDSASFAGFTLRLSTCVVAPLVSRVVLRAVGGFFFFTLCSAVSDLCASPSPVLDAVVVLAVDVDSAVFES